MKSTGVVRKVDELGRIVLPKELRETMDINVKDPLEIFTDGENVVLRKYNPACVFCGDASDVIKGHIFVTHAGCEQSVVDACVKEVRAIAPEADIHVTRAGCTISSHCGRNTLGVLFIRTHEI